MKKKISLLMIGVFLMSYASLSMAKTIPAVLAFKYSSQLCNKVPITFTNESTCGGSFTLDYGDGSTADHPSSPTATTTHTYADPGTYVVTLTSTGCGSLSAIQTITISACNLTCADCIGSFSPEPGDYIISAWVKKESSSPTDLTYTTPLIYIEFPTPTYTVIGPFTASGAIIDGWQRLEGTFTITSSNLTMNIKLDCFSGNCLFDDIRIFPVNGSMKSYVYDPVTLRLVAELDERNYATFYEYDEEGKLIRVKKETEKGIMTIKENKNSTFKK